ncbi:selenophosphate synthetase [Fictibacillus phosphorivorans]|uniref:Selenide, water dikinase n=1 Tax=Fictibacillus phosphorivorans TaxID=1221500 RepID=A0A160ILM6_9BACL|nr:selenophosphate synthetase [Fictibacillus phosphorivorans]
MRHLPKSEYDPNLLVGLDTSDDAGVYKLTDDLAMIQTVDFFTPIVDDPYMFGQIAAANSLSDVYAMGGRPTTVMNIVGFPINTLGHDVLAEILKGAADKVKESGAVLVGGHSIDDSEPKFGLSVTGLVHPSKVYKNVGARPGDVLVLTKPIGVGIQTTAIKKDKLTVDQLQLVSETMAALNKTAAECLEGLSPNAVTDVTGFGLLGHATEMAKGTGDITIEIDYDRVPLLPGTTELAQEGIVPGGSKANHRWIKDDVQYGNEISQWQQWILCDAVTSGGLLVSLSESEAREYVERLHKNGINDASIVGRVLSFSQKPIKAN